MDDHSTDGSWEILEGYAKKDARFKIVKRPNDRKKGGNAARNYAFELSTGEFINWVDSDDILVPCKLEKQLNQIVLTNSDIVLGKIENSDDRLPIRNFIFETNKNKRPIKFLKGDFWFQTSVPLFTRVFLLSMDSMFSENLVRNQEGEFFTRILLKKPEISFINEVMVFRVFDENSIFARYKLLKPNEKIKLDYPVFSMFPKLFQSSMLWDDESKEYFVNWYIRVVQEAEFNFIEFSKLFYLTFLYGSNYQRWIFVKSIVYTLLTKH
mgnify:CR=1 FL=1